LTKLESGELLFQATDRQDLEKWNGLRDEHRKVYQEVSRAGDKGCWSRSLKDSTNLNQHAIAKLTKDLIGRKLIKEVKTINQPGRKVFMLYEIQPSVAVSGGTWYQGGEFAQQWIEQLRERCLEYVHQQQIVSLPDLHSYIQEQPGPSTPTPEEVAQIMRTLQLDELIYAREKFGVMHYCVRKGTIDIFASRLPKFLTHEEEPAVSSVPPCIRCPLQNECNIGGRIDPRSCGYMTVWLQGGYGEGSAGPFGVSSSGPFGASSSNIPMNDVSMMNDW